MTPGEGPLRVISSDSLLDSTLPPAGESSSPAAKPPPREPFEVELDYPIRAHNETVTRLRFRPPKTKELKIVDALGKGLDTQAICELIVLLGDIPMSSVDMLDPVDLTAISRAFLPFFKKPDPNS